MDTVWTNREVNDLSKCDPNKPSAYYGVLVFEPSMGSEIFTCFQKYFKTFRDCFGLGIEFLLYR